MVADPNDYEAVANPNDYEPVAQPAPTPVVQPHQIEPSQSREATRPTVSLPNLTESIFGEAAGRTVQNAQEAGMDVVRGIPGMVESLPGMAYQGLKFASGGPQEKAQVIEQAAAEALPQGRQIAQDVESPLGSRESFRGLASLGMLAIPSLTEAIFGRATPEIPADVEKPPIQPLTESAPREPSPLIEQTNAALTEAAPVEAQTVSSQGQPPSALGQPKELGGQVADTGAKPVSETNIYFGDKGEVLGKSTGGERSILPDVEFEKSAAAVEHTHPEVSPASATDINSFVQNPLKQMRVALPDGTKWMFEKPENWRYPRELSGHDVKMLVREVHQQELQGDPNRTFKQIYHDQNAAVAEKLGLTFHGEDTGSKPDVPVSTEGEATVALGNTKEITPTAETQTTRSEVTQEGQAAPPEKPPVQTEPTGINTERLQQIYGNDSVLVTKGHSPDEFQRIGQSDKRDPYAVLGKSQQSGIAVPDDVPVMRAEHQRLLNVARDAYGTPQYNELAQQAVDFANAIKTVAHGPASEIFRSLQDVDKPRFDSPADFENIVRERMNRESTPQEKQVFQKASDDVVNSRNESSSSATEAQTRLREYKPNETISFDEAVDHVREQIAALTKNC